MEAGLADLAPASPHGPCVGVARRVLRPTMLHGAKREDGGGIEDWMLDKLRSGEWRAHGGMARKRTGARREPKIFTIGSLSSRRKYSSGWLRFWNCGVIGHWDRHCWSHIFPFISKTKVFGMYFGYSWRCSYNTSFSTRIMQASSKASCYSFHTISHWTPS